MKITVDTERTYWKTCDSIPVIKVRVKVDGKEDIGLSQLVSEEEIRSHFDILWEYLGQKVKNSYAESEAKDED